MTATAIAWCLGLAPWSWLRWVNAFSGYFYLPAYPLLVAALVTRQKRLASSLAVVVAWHLTLVVPSVLSLHAATAIQGAREGVQAGDFVPLRVFYANVGAKTGDMESLFEEMRSADADLIVLTEFSGKWHDKFNQTEFPAAYPHHVHLTEYNHAATGIYSRAPLSREERVYQQKRVVVSTNVELDNAQLRVYAVHAPRPIKSPLHRYDLFWSIVEDELVQEALPLLLVGRL